MTAAWSFFATTLDGEGGETLLVPDLPITGPSITEALSGSDSLTGSIEPEYRHLTAPDGKPVLIPWQTAIYAEQEGVIRFGGILRGTRITEGSKLELDVVGFIGYLEGLPWTNSPYAGYDVDPAEALRLIWKYAQQHPHGNLGVTLSADVHTTARLGVKVMEDNEQPAPTSSSKITNTKTTTTKVTTTKTVALHRDGNTITTTVETSVKDRTAPKLSVKRTRIMTAKTTKLDRTVSTIVTKQTYIDASKTWHTDDVKTTSSTIAPGTKVSTLGQHVTSDEPWTLTPWETHDLLQTFNDVAEVGSLDYRERHTWTADRSTIRHEIILGHPRMGRRRDDIAFMIGVNVDVPDCELDADDYASEVLVLGAGEGAKMVRAWAANPDAKRLRRVAVVQRKGIGRVATAAATAQTLAKAYNSFAQDIDTLTIHDHPSAPLGSWEPGDEIYLDGDAGWGGLVGQWVRVLSTTYSPVESETTATVTVRRVGKV